MSPQAIPDLPKIPDAMPAESMRPMIDSSDRPSQREIAVAIADADCREITGYSRVYYRTEWAMQITALRNNYAHLSALPEKVKALEVKIDEVLAAHGARGRA